MATAGVDGSSQGRTQGV